MMKYIQLCTYITILFITLSCNNTSKKKITKYSDYSAYLFTKEKSALENAKTELQFWQKKLESTPNQYPYLVKLANANSRLFKITGKIDYLKVAESNLLEANAKVNFTNAGYLRSLASNYISQHRFKEALEILKKAEDIGEKLDLTHYMLVDVYLELGDEKMTETYLSKLKNFTDFNYLIRLSKYNDHHGNLDKAISLLEKSLVIAKSSKKKNLIVWNYTNLGDYYGHAGKIEASYNSYLKALQINPNNSYAKKGIAWILYSYERNPEEALKILDDVVQENQSPDYYLLKAEIAEYVGKTIEKENNIKLYLNKVNNSKYGDMYAKYNVGIYTAETEKIDKAIAIAEREVKQRPTAQSYDLLAWSIYKKGNKKDALQIVNNHILGKSFEPEILLHTAQILKANGRVEEAKEIKKELMGSIYELGPLAEKEIKTI